MIRVMLADDQAMVRGALAALLTLETDIEVVAQVGNGDDVLPVALEHRPDVVLMDVDMPGTDGLRATASLLERLPATRVLIVTTFGPRCFKPPPTAPPSPKSPGGSISRKGPPVITCPRPWPRPMRPPGPRRCTSRPRRGGSFSKSPHPSRRLSPAARRRSPPGRRGPGRRRPPPGPRA